MVDHGRTDSCQVLRKNVWHLTHTERCRQSHPHTVLTKLKQLTKWTKKWTPKEIKAIKKALEATVKSFQVPNIIDGAEVGIELT